MKRKPNAASKAWKSNDLIQVERSSPYSKRNDVHRPEAVIPVIKCPTCHRFGHTNEAHFDQYQFLRKEEIRDEYGEPIRDYSKGE
jgi:hypothetical protein